MQQNNISDEQKIYELSLIWKEAEYNFAFWERLSGSLDWDRAYKEALAAVLKTSSLYEYYLELMRFVALLRDGHTLVQFPKAISASPEYSAQLPIVTSSIGGELVITNVRREAADKVKRWSVIKKINGVDTAKYVEQSIYPYIWHEKTDSCNYWVNRFFVSGPAGSEVELELEYDDIAETAALTRTGGDTDWLYIGSTPEADEKLREQYKSDSHRIAMTEDGIAIITIDTMANNDLPNEFYGNFTLLESAKAHIIDIRNNGGGSSVNSDAVAAAFIDGSFARQRSLHPIHIGAYKAWGRNMKMEDKTYEQVVAERGSSDWIEKVYKITHRQYYEDSTSKCNRNNCPGVLTAPLVVLASPNTASAAEDLLIALDFNNRATIVGAASYGSTGNPLLTRLESGGHFQICTRNCTYPDGREFINIGVKPHIHCEMTLDDYINETDSVMNKGIEVIRGLV